MVKDTDEQIRVLEKSLNSRYTPENLKEKIRQQIKKLQGGNSPRTVKEALKKYYSRRDIKSVTVMRDGKQLTYKTSDFFDGAHFPDKKEKGGTLESEATYIKASDVVHITTTDGELLKPQNGFWIKNDAKPVYEYGGELPEVIDESVQEFQIRQYLAKGGEVSGTGLATAAQKNIVKTMNFHGADARVINEGEYDEENKTYSWEVAKVPNVIGEGFSSEHAAYEDLIKFMKIRQNLYQFYWKIGYDDYPVAPNSKIETDYADQLNMAQELIYKGNVKGALKVVEGEGESFSKPEEKYFFSLFKDYNKKKSSSKKNDGRKGNGNPIFQKAKEIRLPDEPWREAVKRANEMLK